jgi:hypothetical protein
MVWGMLSYLVVQTACLTCPGRGAASFTMHRRAGTHREPTQSIGPGSAAHHAARAARRAASGARKHIFAFSPRVAPELCMYFPPNKGRGATPRGERGMPGARCTRSRACRIGSTRVSHHGRTGTPGIPARDGFNGFLRALPGDRALLSPSPA